jgi:hypothetical protein
VRPFKKETTVSHHSSEVNEDLKRLLGLGATGEYPNGRLNDRDEGEIKIAIAADTANQVVLIDFGKPIVSLGLTGEQAADIAELLHAKALELRGIK